MSYLERQAYITDLLKKEHFLEWLALHENEQIVGQSNTPTGCPIANYLLAQGYQLCHVVTEEIVVNLTRVKPPPWAASFIDAVDETAEPFITKAQAIALLD